MFETWAAWADSDVLLMAMPLFHIAGYDTGVLALHAGMKTIICRDFSPTEALQTIERERISVAFLVPAMILAMLGEPNVEQYGTSSLKSVLYGASPIPIELHKKALQVFRHTGFVQVYGLTETTGVITTLSPEDHAKADPELIRSCGRPISGVEVKIVDGAGSPVAARQVGEIICRTIKNTMGYWNRPDDTSRSIRDGWRRRIPERSWLSVIHDRVKDMIVSGGENIYPAEIESALFGHPDIADIAIIGVPDEKWGEAVKAIIVLKDGRRPSPADLILYARERLAGYKVPKSVEFLEAIPRNASGKLLKRELREKYWKGYERRVN